MGAVYSVELTMGAKAENTDNIIEAVNTVFENYGIEHFKKDVNTIEDVIKTVFVAKSNMSNLTVINKGTYDEYNFNSDFDASYSWEGVMIASFEAMAKYLEDESRLIIYPDNDYDEYVVKNGKAVFVH